MSAERFREGREGMAVELGVRGTRGAVIARVVGGRDSYVRVWECCCSVSKDGYNIGLPRAEPTSAHQ